MATASGRRLGVTLKWMVNLFVLGGAVLIVTLYWWLPWYLRISYSPGLVLHDLNETILPYYWEVFALLTVTGILAEIMLLRMRRFLIHVNQNRPFSPETVKLLRSIGRIAGIIAVVYVPGLFVLQSAFALIVAMVFAIASCFIYILARLFWEAMEYKEENDMTV